MRDGIDLIRDLRGEFFFYHGSTRIVMEEINPFLRLPYDIYDTFNVRIEEKFLFGE